MAIAGSRVAVVRTSLSDPVEDTNEIAVIVGSTRSLRPRQESWVHVDTGDKAPVRVAVEPGGAAAVIVCTGYPQYLYTRTASPCRSPGRDAIVYGVSRDGRVRKLDEGSTIDPRVLRFQNGRVLWRSGSRTHGARLVPKTSRPARAQ